VNLADDITFIDTSILDFYKRIKENLIEEEVKVPVLVRLHDEEYARKVRHDLAFQNTFLTDKYNVEVKRPSVNPTVAIIASSKPHLPPPGQPKRMSHPY
jgi:hypothetical protein